MMKPTGAAVGTGIRNSLDAVRCVSLDASPYFARPASKLVTVRGTTQHAMRPCWRWQWRTDRQNSLIPPSER